MADAPTPAAVARIEAATAQATAQELSVAESNAATTGAVAEIALETAQARIEQAERAAADLAQAALNTEIGRQVTALRDEVMPCLARLEAANSGLSMTVEALGMKVTTLETRLTEITAIPAAVIPAVSSNPENSLPAAVIIPDSVPESAEATPANPVAQERKKLMRLI